MSCARSGQTSPRTPSSFPVGNAWRQVLRRQFRRRQFHRRQVLSCPPLPCGVGRGDGSLVSLRMNGVLDGRCFSVHGDDVHSKGVQCALAIQRGPYRRALHRRALHRRALHRRAPHRRAPHRRAPAPTNSALKNTVILSTALVHARSTSVRASQISLGRAPLRRVGRRRARGWHAAVRARPRACEVVQPV